MAAGRQVSWYFSSVDKRVEDLDYICEDQSIELGDVCAVTCTGDIRCGNSGRGAPEEVKFLVRSRAGFVMNKKQ